MAFSYVGQVGSDFNATNSTSVNVVATAGAGIPAGDLIVIAATKSINVASMTATTSRAGNTITQRQINSEPVDTQCIALLSCIVSVAIQSGDTFSVTFGGTFTAKLARVLQFHADNAITYGSGNNADSTFPHTTKTSGNLASVPVGNLVIGAWVENFAPETWTAGSGYTGLAKVENGTTSSLFIEYDLDGPTSVGTVNPGCTVATGSSSAGVNNRYNEATPSGKALVVPHRSTQNALLRR